MTHDSMMFGIDGPSKALGDIGRMGVLIVFDSCAMEAIFVLVDSCSSEPQIRSH